MTSSDNFIVWGVFVGDKGNQLEIFNSKMGLGSKTAHSR